MHITYLKTIDDIIDISPLPLSCAVTQQQYGFPDLIKMLSVLLTSFPGNDALESNFDISPDIYCFK